VGQEIKIVRYLNKNAKIAVAKKMIRYMVKKNEKTQNVTCMDKFCTTENIASTMNYSKHRYDRFQYENI